MVLSPIISKTPNPIEATDTGKYNIKVYFKELLRDKPHNRQPTKTVPLLLIPGSRATICIRPIIIASL